MGVYFKMACGLRKIGKPQESKNRNSFEPQMAPGISVAEVNVPSLYCSAIYVTQLLRLSLLWEFPTSPCFLSIHAISFLDLTTFAYS